MDTVVAQGITFLTQHNPNKEFDNDELTKQLAVMIKLSYDGGYVTLSTGPRAKGRTKSMDNANSKNR